MKSLTLTFLLLILGVVNAGARAVRVLDMKSLVSGSQMVLVGKVKSVKPSGITTTLAYPTWDDVVFEWLSVELDVIEPIKGARKGAIVRTLMLSTRGSVPLINAPGMVDPKVGQHHLLCLLPTKFKGVFASITAPFDDDQGIFILDRSHWEYGPYRKNPRSFDRIPEFGERYKAIWSLVNEKGEISSRGAEHLRKKYKAEVATPAPRNAVIHLEWKKETSESGLQWNVPADGNEKATHDRADQPATAREAKPSSKSKRRILKPLWRRR